MIRAVIKDSLVYGIASILSRGLSLLVLPIYTRVLTPSDYGALDMIVMLGALANLVVALEVQQGLARFWGEMSSNSAQRRLASTAWWFSISMYILFLISSLLLSEHINSALFGTPHLITALRLGLIFITINGIFYLLQNQFRWELRSKEYASVSFLYSCFTLIFSGGFSYGLNLGLNGILLGQILAVALVSIISWWRLRNTLVFEFDKSMLLRMLVFSAPLVPSAFATFLSLYVNRLALNILATLNDVGLFGVGSRIAGMVTLLTMGINSGLTPLIYKHFAEKDTPKNLARIFDGFIVVALLGCLSLSLFSKELLFLFTPLNYHLAYKLVYFLAPAFLLAQIYIFFPGISIKNKNHFQLIITTLASLISIFANWSLVPLLGIYGAAIATLLSSLIFLLFWIFFSQKLYHIPFKIKAVLLAAFVFSTCQIAGFFIDEYRLLFIQGFFLKLTLLLIMLTTCIRTGLVELTNITPPLKTTIKKIKNQYFS